jgi:hypothetical protein
VDRHRNNKLKTFLWLVVQGKLHAAVWYLTKQEKGGVLLPDDRDEKTGETILDVLQSKHPDARAPDTSVMEEYDTLPDLVEIGKSSIKWLGKLQAVLDQWVRIWLLSSDGYFDLVEQANNFVKRWRNIQVGWPTKIHHGPRTELFGYHNVWHETKVQEKESVQ